MAVKKGNDKYVVNGQKVWTSRAEYSDLMLLLARTTPQDEVRKRTDGLSVFIVDMRAAKGSGLNIRPIRAMVNHATTEVFFDNLEIPADSLIGEEGKGFRYILDGMNAERILISYESIGDARWFIEKATRYANERKVFGRPIGQNQGYSVPDSKSLCRDRSSGPYGGEGGQIVRGRKALWCRIQYGEAADGGSCLGCCGYLPANPWRFWIRRRI